MAKLNYFWKAYIGRFWYFDVLKESVEKILPFRVGPKWGAGSSRLIPHRLSRQRLPKTPPGSLDTLNITQDITSKHPKTTLDTTNTTKHNQTSSDTLIRPTDTPRTPLKHSKTLSLHFGTTLKGDIIFNLSLLRHINIKTSLCKLAKNDWVLPFLLFFRSVRKKLQVTVSLDHPVYHKYITNM